METIKVLLVDDEKPFLDTVQKRLNRRKIQTSSVLSGDDALAFLNQYSVDVVVLDMKMPGLDGIQTLSKIKQSYPNIEVIMLSGHADMNDALTGMEQGAFDYLVKPMNFDELFYKIKDAYKKKNLRQGK